MVWAYASEVGLCLHEKLIISRVCLVWRGIVLRASLEGFLSFEQHCWSSHKVCSLLVFCFLGDLVTARNNSASSFVWVLMQDLLVNIDGIALTFLMTFLLALGMR